MGENGKLIDVSKTERRRRRRIGYYIGRISGTFRDKAETMAAAGLGGGEG